MTRYEDTSGGIEEGIPKVDSSDTTPRIDNCALLTFVDVRRVGLLSSLGPLLLVARGGGSLLASLRFLLGGRFSCWCLTSGGRLLLGSFGRHFG